jgi:predicted MPP superfamily phosphohydrolase
MALGFSALPFLSLIYGMIKGAFNYKIHRLRITLPNLPNAFNGLKIIQVSDIHSGSFISKTPLEEAVKIIMAEKADVIFFTGDLVNDRTSEVDEFINTLKKISAPMGVFSILGNHDYGDYVTWETAELKKKNMQDMYNAHEKIGWELLINRHITLKKGESEIAIIGVENWGGNLHFPKYGDIKKAYQGAEKYPVKILLSHDPSHWSMQITKEYKEIDLTLSGHTHGFQFGIEIPGLKWSPSQYIYKQWAGLYSEGNQQIYVNRGLGFLGYPGRVGIMPEITVLELYNTQNIIAITYQ